MKHFILFTGVSEKKLPLFVIYTHYLTGLDYGNGDSVDYTYDELGRVTKETYEDGATVSYAYDNNGDLATVTDAETGRSYSYYYDFTGRLMKYKEIGINPIGEVKI